MKRKNEATEDPLAKETKKRAVSDDTLKARFREDLFVDDVLEDYTQSYATSKPYKHAVISSLIQPELLRAVRHEIQNNITFTPKETDIYKIFQSGDLANLDGLDDASLEKLPSLLKLRDALYSSPFRKYLSAITGAGKLSGKKTDMAVNVYTGGCHLLCHDDVIGSRRISYILYLTHPDHPWQPNWGGALRLFPTTTVRNAEGKDVKIPEPEFSLSIPPAFNQLSFFAVQPGESFHDVEEVYQDRDFSSAQDLSNSRTRMAISGWFHIPQEGEDGFEEGLEEKLADRSTLQQLQGPADQFDQPQPHFVQYAQPETDPEGTDGEGHDFDEDVALTEEDLEFLIKYMAPTYLTPDTLEEITENFQADSLLRLETFLSRRFADRLRAYIEGEESNPLPTSSLEIEQETNWRMARPPHKHRFLFQQADAGRHEVGNPIQELLQEFLPSVPFKKWLTLATGLEHLLSHDILARRFRKGQDYTLASAYEGDLPRLEFTIGLTPTDGWGNDGDEEEEDDESDSGNEASKMKQAQMTIVSEATAEQEESPILRNDEDVGGYEAYMAGDDDDADDDGDDDDQYDDTEKDRVEHKMKMKRAKADPAIYQAAADEEDDGVLFSMPAGWNRFSLVLRDMGTLKFVKYVSKSANGDRWDITGAIELEKLEFDELDEIEMKEVLFPAEASGADSD